MPRLRILLAALGASAIFIAPALAQENEELCMAPVEITEALVRDAAMFDFRGYAGEAAAPAFVTGGLSPLRDSEDAATVFGTVVFLPDGQGGWRAFMPRPGESVVAAYAARESGAMILVTQWQIEGPGQSWTLLRSSDGFATGECVTIDFPDALNQPSWTMETLELRDLDIAANGRGEIIGVSNTENHGALLVRLSHARPRRRPGARRGACAANAKRARAFTRPSMWTRPRPKRCWRTSSASRRDDDLNRTAGLQARI